MYYWDTYWIVSGLLLLDMKKTAKGVIENFVYLVQKIGRIPNGTRKYYLERTQPPFFIIMVNSYYEKTGDINFVRKYIDVS